MSRELYGEGTIRLRKDGRWEAVFQDADYNGGKRKSVYGRSEQEVKRKLRVLKKEAHKNDQINIKKITLENYINHWLVTVKKNKLKPMSYDREEATILNQIVPEIGNIQLANVNTDDVQELLNTLFEKGLSHSTVKKTYDTCNKLISIRSDGHHIVSKDALIVVDN